MNLFNFTLAGDNIAVELLGQYIDLHNNFDFVEIVSRDDEVSFKWRRLEGHWVATSLPQFFTISVVGVDYYEVRGKPSDSLDEVGFFTAETLGDIDYNGRTAPVDSSDILIFRFVGGAEIAIRGQSAVASLAPFDVPSRERLMTPLK
ncbi:hypothetical protein [Rhodoferax sp.]|uniref:hypothetical protein n=1 Tax=Rhodoferax sp. TaxID=50421 RepID=UPI0025E17317|nr:hypothetical protein [Rhodoferax sp.]